MIREIYKFSSLESEKMCSSIYAIAKSLRLLVLKDENKDLRIEKEKLILEGNIELIML